MANTPADRANAEAKKDLKTRVHRLAADKRDRMHLYVNGKHRLTVDADKAHAAAAEFARTGDSVWITRRAVTM